MKIRESLIVLSLMLGTAIGAVAQDYYDDDIYYNADKARKEQAEKARKAAEERKKAAQPLPGSDMYVVNTGNNRDVDEYNRRYVTREVVDTTMNENGDFVYTRRIERFYNPDIVAASGNEDLQYNYYESLADQNSTNVNIYVTNPDPWYYSAWAPSWYYSWGYPYYYRSSWWGPSWSWSWNWGWGPSWSWGWGYPGWGYPGWGYPGGGWAWVPSRPYHPSVGGMITHRPNQGNYNNGYGPTYGGHRPGSATNRYNGTTQNGNRNENYNNGTQGGRRPGANTGNNNNNNNNSSRHNYDNSNRNSGFGNSGGRRSGSNFGGGGTYGGHRGGGGSTGGGRRR